MGAERRGDIVQGAAQIQRQFRESRAVASEWDDGAQSEGGLRGDHGVCVQHQLFQVRKTSRKRLDFVVCDKYRVDVSNNEYLQVLKTENRADVRERVYRRVSGVLYAHPKIIDLGHVEFETFQATTRICERDEKLLKVRRCLVVRKRDV